MTSFGTFTAAREKGNCEVPNGYLRRWPWEDNDVSWNNTSSNDSSWYYIGANDTRQYETDAYGNDVFYRVYKHKETFDEASRRCLEDGARLAEIRNQESFDAVWWAATGARPISNSRTTYYGSAFNCPISLSFKLQLTHTVVIIGKGYGQKFAKN